MRRSGILARNSAKREMHFLPPAYRIVFAVISVTAGFAVPARAQDYIPRNLWQPFVTVGYQDAHTGDLESFYDNLLDYYRSDYVPVISQSNFGPTLHLGAGFLYSPLKPLWIGLGASFYRSSASSSYRDYAGTLRVTGQLDSYQFDIIARGSGRSLIGLPLFVSLKPGIALAYPNVTQHLVLTDSPTWEYMNTTASPSWTIKVEATLGAVIPAGPFSLSVEGGYRFASSGEIAYSPLVPVPGGLPTGNRMASWSVEQTGFVFDVSVGFNIGKDNEEETAAADNSPGASGSRGEAGAHTAEVEKNTPVQLIAAQAGSLIVSVSPDTAGNAGVTVVRKSVMKKYPGYTFSTTISPDTIGTRKAPLSMSLGFGDYDVIARQNGYGDEIQSVSIADSGATALRFHMYTLDQLSTIRTWSTIKWITAGVAAGSGIAAIILKGQIDTFAGAYRNDSTVPSIQSDRSKISSAQSWLGITSSVAFSAAGACAISWLMEALNR